MHREVHIQGLVLTPWPLVAALDPARRSQACPCRTVGSSTCCIQWRASGMLRAHVVLALLFRTHTHNGLSCPTCLLEEVYLAAHTERSADPASAGGRSSRAPVRSHGGCKHAGTHDARTDHAPGQPTRALTAPCSTTNKHNSQRTSNGLHGPTDSPARRAHRRRGSTCSELSSHLFHPRRLKQLCLPSRPTVTGQTPGPHYQGPAGLALHCNTCLCVSTWA
jgi:hypothetical protein